jgi:hypothetical protein
MGKQALKYWAFLIGAYIGVYYATGAGKILDSSTKFVVGTTKALQGRG